MGVIYHGFADEVVKFRAEHGLSQQALADLCNTTKATINRVEGERGGITKYTKAKIDRIIKENNRDD